MKKRILTLAAFLFGIMYAEADNISVPDVTIEPGQSATVAISLNNTEANLVSFQMDLTLPAGISINKNGCSLSSRFTDEDQELTIGKQGTNVYRLTSTSFALIPITGTSGEIITLSLTASDNSEGGTATLSNIRFVSSESGKVLVSDASFSITVATPSPAITFADGNVKTICVANWDTNNDGELSEAEAADVTSLGEVFRGNTEITSFDEISYFTGLTGFDDDAFNGCSGLTSFTIPSNITSIGRRAFQYCSSLTSITIPESVTDIYYHAFSYCTGITSITVDPGNGVYDSRYDCNAIIKTSANQLVKGCKNTVIPDNVTRIGNNSFVGCTGLTTITIPESVTAIGNSAFYNCSNLTSITIPNSVTSIEAAAFSGCNSLTTVTVEMSTPFAINENVFSNRANATLYVPAGSKAAYQTADYWKEFNEIVEVIKIGDLSTQSNALYIEPINACKGGNTNIQVKLKNSGSVTSYGLDLVLPEGITIATDNGGSFDSEVTLSNRHASNHAATTNKVSDNVYRIGIASLNSKTLSGNDGAVLTIRAHVAEGMEVGEYPIIVRNPLIVNSNGTKPEVFEMRSKVTIDDYQKGDVDGDGVIDLADAVLVINHYVGKLVTNFIEKAADVDGDGVIDLADAVLIINYYVGKIPSLSRETEETEQEPQ